MTTEVMSVMVAAGIFVVLVGVFCLIRIVQELGALSKRLELLVTAAATALMTRANEGTTRFTVTRCDDGTAYVHSPKFINDEPKKAEAKA